MLVEEANRIRLIGGTGSPYTQKMLALLRYRRIPYSILWDQVEQACQAMGVEPPRPALMPTFLLGPKGSEQAVCDSTPIIRRLEDDYPGRSVLLNRMNRRDSNGMPPLGSNAVDAAGTDLIAEWINSIGACL